VESCVGVCKFGNGAEYRSGEFVPSLQEIPRRMPSLRSIGITFIVFQYWTLLHPAVDLAAFRSLEMPERIRWEALGGNEFNCNPLDYAGPSLRHGWSSMAGDPHE